MAIGMNIGTAQIYQQSHFLADFGLWFDYLLCFGICYRDVFQDERLLRAGATYTFKSVNLMYEIEYGGYDQQTDHNLGIGYIQYFKDLKLNACLGYDLHDLAFTMGLAYKQFELGFLLSDSLKVNIMVSIFLEPPVREKIVVFQETLEVFVQKPTIKKKSPDKKVTTEEQLTASEKLACEQHYLKGVEYFINNQLDEAITEWNLVVKICPTYKDVKRYLDNAHAKKEILKKE